MEDNVCGNGLVGVDESGCENDQWAEGRKLQRRMNNDLCLAPHSSGTPRTCDTGTPSVHTTKHSH